MCIFCSIGEGTSPAHIIYEDGATVAFLDISPSAPGHTMVITKKHYNDFMDMPEDEIGRAGIAVQKVSKMLERALGADNFTIGINSGKIVGRHVDHVHIHIIPRFLDDGGVYVQGVVSKSLEEDLADIKEKIIKTKDGD